MIETTTWVLSVAYWLHMLATVVWIGALSALLILVLPVARKVVGAAVYPDLLIEIQRGLDPLA